MFSAGCGRNDEAIVLANSPHGADPRIAGPVLTGALAGAVHEAAMRGTLAEPVLRRELVLLVDGYVGRRRAG